jgi:glucose-1-phosphate cytidylyltransferase
MKAVILAGGLGSRISEETYLKPKPMIEIGNRPILWHIMKSLSFYGIKHFIVCCGYKSEYIKDYFINYIYNQHDIRINLSKRNTLILDKKKKENWIIDLINTGDDTATGGRLKLLKKYLKKNEYFLMTYGDGLSDINLKKLISFHKKNLGKTIVTAVQPAGRFGSLKIDHKNLVQNFLEKPKGDGNWVNGGFFIINEKNLNLIKNLNTPWEDTPLKTLAKKQNLIAFKHYGFWKAMDTISDKKILDQLWNSNQAPWKNWKSET